MLPVYLSCQLQLALFQPAEAPWCSFSLLHTARF